MNNASDFIIENGVLQRYIGTDEEVLVPEGVREIGWYKTNTYRGRAGAFENNTTLKKLILPDGLVRIDPLAFSECTNLEEIQLPDTVEDVDFRAFMDTPWFKNYAGPELYVGNVFVKYFGDSPEVYIRPGTKTVAMNAFYKNKYIVKVVVPEGVQRIGTDAFSNCDHLEELVIPNSVVDIGYLRVCMYCQKLRKVSGGVLHKTVPLMQTWDDFYTGEPEDTAWIVLYQTEKTWTTAARKMAEKKPDMLDAVISTMCDVLKNTGESANDCALRAAAFVLKHYPNASSQSVRKLYVALEEMNLPALKKLKGSKAFMAHMGGGEVEDISKLPPAEAKVVQVLKRSTTYDAVFKLVKKGIRYADGKKICTPRVLAFVISEYAKQIHTSDLKDITDYAHTAIPCAFSPVADEVAAALDREQLMAYLKKFAEQNGAAYWLPYARYANEAEVTQLISQMKDWEQWRKYDAKGRKNIIASRSGLLLNDSCAAIDHIDRAKQLDAYAKIRGTDADTIRDKYLSDVGLDENGGKTYDLGNQVVTVRMQKDLSFLVELPTGKTAKSLPKKGADEEKYAAANVNFAEIKKNAKKIVKNRANVLFEDFLSGRTKRADSWQESYLRNPLLRQVASLLVWVQDGKTFTVTDNGPIVADGAAYVIGDGEIALAHPVEMTAEDVAMWQKYFTSNGMKQPFNQIWEPSIDAASIKEDRYEDCMIPYYRFANQDKHGIHVEDTDFHNSIYIYFDDCKGDVKRIDQMRHSIEMDHRFEVQKISFEKFTRKVNHIIAYLDRVTIMERIKKDDVYIAAFLPSFTLAQITEFIRVATENNCTNVTALLLDYKNQNFTDFDPMEEFSLDL